MTGRRTVALAVAAIGAAALVPIAVRADDVGCSAAPAPGGEWVTYGHDLDNSRTQPAEDTIDASNAGTLEPAFVFRGPGLLGTINMTPIVAGGCVFVSSSDDGTAATVTALDADDGARRWAHRIDVGGNAYGGSVVGSPAVDGELLLVPVNRVGAQGGPFVRALHRDTGELVWDSEPLDTQPDTGTNASVTVWNGIAVIGFFGKAGPDEDERGGVALLDTATGELLARTYTIPDDDFAEGYAGAGVWSTAAVDPATGHAYVGSSNPHDPHRIHERSTSLLKIDIDRTRATFGQIVDWYQGLRDTIVPGAQEQPVCETAPDVHYYGEFSATCLAVDVDFGASPNLIHLADGRTLLGGHQKAGVYHVVDTDGMDGLSMTPVGAPCFACSAASSAFADGRAFVPAGPPGQLVAVDVTNGAPAWASPIAGGFTFNPASTANGLVWMTDSNGFLDAFDQATGAPVLKRRMADDTGESMATSTSSAGVAIANHTVYAALGSHLVAYRLPGGNA